MREPFCNISVYFNLHQTKQDWSKIMKWHYLYWSSRPDECTKWTIESKITKIKKNELTKLNWSLLGLCFVVLISDACFWIDLYQWYPLFLLNKSLLVWTASSTEVAIEVWVDEERHMAPLPPADPLWFLDQVVVQPFPASQSQRFQSHANFQQRCPIDYDHQKLL